MRYVIFVLVISIFSGCKGLINPEVEEESYSSDWTTETHSNDADPNYDVVFPQNEVLRFDITIPAENWVQIQSDLADNIGAAIDMGGGPGGGGPGGGGPGDNIPNDDLVSSYTPIWVSANLEFNDMQWQHIGIRVKGNSSLNSVYNSSIDKFSFKLDFDQFEDDYPEIFNQRFYGFKQLNLNNNFNDYSCLHEKMAPELFSEFGLVAPQTAFAEVYIDYGEGAQYFGLYTLVEEVDNTVIKTQYTDDSGNLYKPEGTGATFASGSFSTNDMYPKTNEETTDYSDVTQLYEALNNTNRTSDTAAWKQELENIFNVDVFLKWLAVNTTIQNWDTYGRMTHNFYLYNNPETQKLEWIPWDNNEAFYEGKLQGAVAIDFSDVENGWPLITYLMDVPGYKNKYKTYLLDFINQVFTQDNMYNKIEKYEMLISDKVTAEEPLYSFTSASLFENEIAELKQHVINRQNVVINYAK